MEKAYIEIEPRTKRIVEAAAQAKGQTIDAFLWEVSSAALAADAAAAMDNAADDLENTR